jgi:hypothetical protein
MFSTTTLCVTVVRKTYGRLHGPKVKKGQESIGFESESVTLGKAFHTQ